MSVLSVILASIQFKGWVSSEPCCHPERSEGSSSYR